MRSDNDYTDNFQKAMAVLAAHKIALWEYDCEGGEISVDKSYFEVLGLDRAGIHFTNLEEAAHYIHPDDQAIFNPWHFRERLMRNEALPPVCLRLVGKDGQIVWLEESFFAVQSRNVEGIPLRLIFYSENITERCQREAQIRQLEERNRKIIAALPEFIFILDDNFIIRDVLMAEGTTLFHTVEELINLDGHTVYSPEVSDLFLQTIRACLADGKIREIEYPLDTEGRERHYFQARIAPFEDNKVLALIHDIGDRMERAAELLAAKRKAEESDRMKSLFLANMSHEIRTPLNAIIGFSEILVSADDPAEKEEYAGIIRKNSDLLLQLINDVLDLSRIESGKSEMILQRTELSGLLEEIAQVQRLKMNGRVEFCMESPGQKIGTLTDRHRVMQVLFNFLSNAMKNTESGSITLGMEQDGEWLRLYVRDTGCGIPEEKRSSIFGHFEKLDEFKPGTGLGLAICQSIADGLGGRIEVASRLGEGSTFTLVLPHRETQ